MASAETERKCSNCGAEKSITRCEYCNNAWYCLSKEQAANCKACHKAKCRKLIFYNRHIPQNLKETFMRYTQYIHQYYSHQISSNEWVQEMNINQAIIYVISSFSIGIIRDCNNDNCKYEILINDESKNLFDRMQSIEGYLTDDMLSDISEYSDSDSDESQFLPLKYRIKRVANECKNEDGVYYHDDIYSMLYCTDCSKSMRPCLDHGIIFEKDVNSFLHCSHIGSRQIKRCLIHRKCETCNAIFCGRRCRNIVNKQDLCKIRNCSRCGKEGCPNCVPMIKYK